MTEGDAPRRPRCGEQTKTESKIVNIGDMGSKATGVSGTVTDKNGDPTVETTVHLDALSGH